MTGASTALPAGFEELEPFVAQWVRDSNDERWTVRSSLPMSQIQAFYDAVTARAEDGIAYLDQFPLDRIPEDATRLFKLLLAMAHAAIAVEMHGQPRAHNSRFPHNVHVKQGPMPFGGSVQ